MKKDDIAELIEKSMIESVADNIGRYLTLTDFGIVLNDKDEKVYRTHFLVKINAVQDTPVDKCHRSVNPVEERKANDREQLEIIAAGLLGFV